MTITVSEMAGRIEHTLLAAETTPDQIDALCDQAVRYGLRAVCVNPVYVRRAVERLNASRGFQPVGPTFESVERQAGKPFPHTPANRQVKRCALMIGLHRAVSKAERSVAGASPKQASGLSWITTKLRPEGPL